MMAGNFLYWLGNKAQLKFEFSENINGLKNQSVKNYYFIADINGAQVIENTTQRNFPFSDFFIEATYWKH